MAAKKVRTAEQREADAIYLRSYTRKYKHESWGDADAWAKELAEVPSCENLRARIMVFIGWLRGQAEALRNPITRRRVLVEPTPLLGADSDDIFDTLMAVEDIGKAVQKSMRRRKSTKGASRGA